MSQEQRPSLPPPSEDQKFAFGILDTFPSYASPAELEPYGIQNAAAILEGLVAYGAVLRGSFEDVQKETISELQQKRESDLALYGNAETGEEHMKKYVDPNINEERERLNRWRSWQNASRPQELYEDGFDTVYYRAVREGK